MKVLIDIPQEMFKATQTYYSDFTTRLSMKACTEIIANGTPIPDNATNGDMIKAMFPYAKIDINEMLGVSGIVFVDSENEIIPISQDWWNAPYKKNVLM